MPATRKTRLVTDLGACRPSSALSVTPDPAGRRWRLLPYETLGGEPARGVMLGAPAHHCPPEVSLDLGADGWHHVAIGIWSPPHDHDGPVRARVKLDGDPCFKRLVEPQQVCGRAVIKEAFFRTADLTGRRLVISKHGGPDGGKAYIAWVRLTPLVKREVDELLADRARTDTRTMQATIDGISYFSRGSDRHPSSRYEAREDLVELVEPFRHTDVGKLVYACSYGETVNYHSEAGIFLGGSRENAWGDAPRFRGREDLRKLVDRGIVPQEVIGAHARSMGLEFEAMFRLGMFGELPPDGWLPPGEKYLVDKHPGLRQVLADGTPVEIASYAFPEVRARMVSIIVEAARLFEIDGISLCFTRGGRFTSWEKPVLDRYREMFGGDARKEPANSPRLHRAGAGFLDEFVREVRAALDGVEKEKGRRLKLAAWVGAEHFAGLDGPGWVAGGLLDSVVSPATKMNLFDPRLAEAARESACRTYASFIPWLMASQGQEPLREAADYLDWELSALDGLAVWDADSVIFDEALFPLLRMGHREEFRRLASGPRRRPAIELMSVGGKNLHRGLSYKYACG